MELFGLLRGHVCSREMLPSTLLALVLAIQASNGAKIQVHRRARPKAPSLDVSAYCDWSADPFRFTNVRGAAYTGTIHVGGEPFIVQLDTGSSDLWLDTAGTKLVDTNATGVNASITYVGMTTAAGGVEFGDVAFGDYTVRQAFIDAPGSNATDGGVIQGVLGLGPPSASEVHDALVPTMHNGASFMENLFRQYPGVPHYITFLLGRGNLGNTDGGVFTIGELVEDLSPILNAPPLRVASEYSWAAFMDAVVINGTRHTGHSSRHPIAHPFNHRNQTVAVLDTGTTTSTAPPYYVDAMYKHIPGARFDGIERYFVPCDTKMNISLVFGEQEYPMHPIDVTFPELSEDGTVVCAGAFEYNPPDSGVDFLLGDAFLRNVYSLYNFGRWIKPGAADPYMKLLSILNVDDAWGEFDAMTAARTHTLEEAFKKNMSDTGFTPPGTPSACTTELDPSRNSPAAASLHPLLAEHKVLWIAAGGTLVLLLAGTVQALRRRRGRAHGYQLLHAERRLSTSTLSSESSGWDHPA